MPFLDYYYYSHTKVRMIGSMTTGDHKGLLRLRLLDHNTALCRYSLERNVLELQANITKPWIRQPAPRRHERKP